MDNLQPYINAVAIQERMVAKFGAAKYGKHLKRAKILLTRAQEIEAAKAKYRELGGMECFVSEVEWKIL